MISSPEYPHHDMRGTISRCTTEQTERKDMGALKFLACLLAALYNDVLVEGAIKSQLKVNFVNIMVKSLFWYTYAFGILPALDIGAPYMNHYPKTYSFSALIVFVSPIITVRSPLPQSSPRHSFYLLTLTLDRP